MATTGVEELVGRERELDWIDAALGRALSRPELMLLEGEPGIGKTSLWRAGIEIARAKGSRILTTRPAEAEAKLSFSALRDLMIDAENEIGALRSPQRRALRIALVIEEPGHEPPSTHAIAVATLNLLRRLAEEGPLLVAVDDVQWLDASSAGSLAFALRRLTVEPIALLSTARPGGDLALEGLGRLAIGPLDSHALNRVLREALATLPPGPLLRRVMAMSGGNPFYALEIARSLARRGIELDLATPLPIPQDLRTLVRERLRTLPPQTRSALTAAAALAQPTRAAVAAAVSGSSADLDAAEVAGVVEIENGAIRFTHPLLASAAYADAKPEDRRRIHQRLAEIVSDPEERARHLATAVEAPDSEVAAALEDAAGRAFERGAIEGAAELIEQALRFTPESARIDLQRRRLAAAGYLARAGARSRAAEVISGAKADAPRGSERARIGLTESWLGLIDPAARIDALHEILEDAREDPALLIEVHCALGHLLVYGIDLPRAERHASAALELAQQAGSDALLSVALVTAARAAFFAGKGLDVEALNRALALEAASGNYYGDVTVAGGFLGYALAKTDDFAGGRRILGGKAAEERRRGDTGIAWTLQELALLETQAGEWSQARSLVNEALQVALDVEDVGQRCLSYRSLVLLAVLTGDVDQARALAAEGLDLADRFASPMTRSEILSALGLLELSLGNPEEAVARFEGPARFIAEAGLADPGFQRFVPDRVEALVAVGDLETAEVAAAGFEDGARRLARRSALGTAARIRGLIAAARGDLTSALEQLDDACTESQEAGTRFELARTLFVKGRILRGAGQRSDARPALERAAAIFADLGAPIWERNVRAEITRIGGRRSDQSGLTATEQQIADLVASGKTNHEVGRALHLSPKTVEWNLSKIYRKLRVTSRTELAARYADRSDDTARTR